MDRRLPVAIALLIAVVPRSTSAQDVEMLGRRYGKRPPTAYYQELARNPAAFRFSRGRALRMREAAELRRTLRGGGRANGGGRTPGDAAGPARVGPAAAGGPAAVGLGPRAEPVVGDIYVPVVLGLFADSPPAPVTQSQVQDGYFGAQAGSVSGYYAEVSNDSITLHGDVRDWVRSSMTQAEATQGISGLGCCGIGDYIKTLLSQQGAGVDWGAYDNDGPDGLPNSGDDDGYVDALAVIHPTAGAECQGDWPDRIWSHKWTLSDASSGGPFATTTPRTGYPGQVILVEDYFVQGALRCSSSGLNEIGVFTHELGHAFGLPDLYDTRSFGIAHSGAGSWDLMAAGTYGCNDQTPDRPCHMGAWSKSVLGWITVDTLPPDSDLGTLALPPVETSGVAYRVDAGDGSGEYFLLENRQKLASVTYDQSLWAEGLLVWQIDQAAVDARWVVNSVNSHDHMGVWLRQADGLDELGQAGGDRGDSGDPFPGSTANTAFHVASNPAATSYQGTATGLTVVDITTAGDDVGMHLLTRFTQVTLTASGAAPGASGLFAVDGVTVPDPPDNFAMSAPFATRTIEAAPGDSVAPGVRTPFSQWDDDPGQSNSRVVVTPLADTTLSATYAGSEYQLRVDLSGGVNGVAPGSLATTPPSPEPWFTPGTDVTVTANAQTGFNFLAWTGDLAGEPNPAMVTMDAPVFAGADFELTYGVPDTVVDLVAAADLDLQLAVQNGTDPVAWQIQSGSPPLGVVLGTDGSITGASLDLGAFPLVLRATDALGLEATATVTLDVAAPSIPITRLGDVFFLGTQPLDSLEASFLDHQGNDNGAYDLGDFRAWVLANPGLPLSAAVAPVEAEVSRGARVITLPVRVESAEESR